MICWRDHDQNIAIRQRRKILPQFLIVYSALRGDEQAPSIRQHNQGAAIPLITTDTLSPHVSIQSWIILGTNGDSTTEEQSKSDNGIHDYYLP